MSQPNKNFSLSILLPMIRQAVFQRQLSSGWRRLQQPATSASKKSPEQYLMQKQQETLAQQQFETSLAGGAFSYRPKTLTENTINGHTQKPVPLNVELLKYKPIRLPKTHGHEVAAIKFRGYNEDDINMAIEFASRAAYYLGIPVSGIMKQKTEKRLYTVIRSPFAQAKSKENFWRTTFNYKLVGYDANAEVVDLWLSYINKYALEGVNYLAKITARESTDFVDQLDGVKGTDLEVPSGFSESDDPIMERVNDLLQSEMFQHHMNTEAQKSEAQKSEAGAESEARADSKAQKSETKATTKSKTKADTKKPKAQKSEAKAETKSAQSGKADKSEKSA